MRQAVLALCLCGFLFTHHAAADLTVTPLTEGATPAQVKAGVRLFHNYGDEKTVIRTMPAELDGLPAIKAKEPYAPQVFDLSEPARAYWVFYPRVYTSIPKDWKVFRQRAFVTPFDQRDSMSDVYFRDFPAGRHEVKNPPNRLINVGFKALSQMTSRDCVLNIHSPTEEGMFRPGVRLFVNANVDNPTGRALPAVVKWRVSKHPGEWTIDLPLPPRQEAGVELALPDLGAGFRVLDAELWIGTEKVDARRFPVSVFDAPAPDASVAEPFFPVGAYNKFFLTHDAEISRIYLYAICHSLREHHLNTLVGPALDDPKEELDIAAKYGIRILVRVDQQTPKAVFGHPAVLAYMFGDEPSAKDLDRYKERYEEFRKEHSDRPLVSAMVGERVGSLTKDDPVMLWKALDSQVRLARFYPIRKVEYDLLRAPIYKNMLPPFAAFDLIERCSPTPWWYVIQGFGGRPTEAKPDPYWRNPTPEEFAGLAHVALACGARAIISWPLQTHGPEPSAGVALIAQESLDPEDGKYDAFAKIAAGIAKAKEVLLRHQKGAIDVRADRYEVLAMPRTDPQTKRNYIYLVNMDAKKPHEVKVTFSAQTVKGATDLYSGRTIGIQEGAASGKTAVVPLGPGEGQLWELAE